MKKDIQIIHIIMYYISENYDNIIVQANDGPYIVIDLIPNSHDGVHDLNEIIESCNKMNIDITMFTRSYVQDIFDGIRMGRYFYYM